MRNINQSEFYTAVISRYGHRCSHKNDVRKKRSKSIGSMIDTVLLYDIRDSNGNQVCDHLWTDVDDGFADCSRNDYVKFTGSVVRYIKGCYVPRFIPGQTLQTDFKIGNISNVEILKRHI